MWGMFGGVVHTNAEVAHSGRHCDIVFVHGTGEGQV